jgi:putative membrane protein
MTTTEHFAIVITLGTLLLITPGAPTSSRAEISPDAKSSQAMSVSGDSTFVQTAAEAGMAEVKLGQLAEQKSSNGTVKAFGRRMVTDHTKAGDQLKTIAAQKSMSFPASLNSNDQASYDRLAKLSGRDFDVAFAQQMVQDHQQAVSLFQQESSSGNDSALKSFATQTLPTLQDHLRMAQQMQQSVSGSASSRP